MSFVQAGPSPQVRATLELDDSEHAFTMLRDPCSSSVELRKRASSPAGFQWIDLLLADSSADGVQPDEAAGILSLLAESSTTLDVFRIVHGDPWPRRAARPSDDASNRSNLAS